MKVLLTRPPYIIDFYDFPYYIVEPLGLEYIASAIRDDHKVKILDCIGEYWDKSYEISKSTVHIGANWKEVKERISHQSPDVVGISSLFYTQYPSAYRVADIVKEIDKDIKVVIGGGHPSAFPVQTLKECKSIDFVVVGEGEATFKDLLANIKDPSAVKGIAYRIGEVCFQNEPRPLIKNIDEINFPSRDLVPYRNYPKTASVQLRFKILRKIARLLVNAPTDKLYYWIYNTVLHNLHKRIRLPAGSIISSRGCPMDCYFCAIRNVWGNKYRMRSADNVLDEIEILRDKYRVKHISIQDDNFTLSKKRTIEICKGIIDRGLDLTFNCPSGVYLPSLDKEVLGWMEKAGFYELYFGIESGNQHVLDNVIRKHQDLNKVREVIKACKDIEIKTGGYFVIGMPGETIETMHDTINFAESSGLDVARLYTAQPYPGSRLYDDCIKNQYLTKLITPETLKIFGDKCYINTKDFTPSDVEKIVREGREKLGNIGKLGMPDIHAQRRIS